MERKSEPDIFQAPILEATELVTETEAAFQADPKPGAWSDYFFDVGVDHGYSFGPIVSREVRERFEGLMLALVYLDEVSKLHNVRSIERLMVGCMTGFDRRCSEFRMNEQSNSPEGFDD